jgi:hypothetical protein
MEKGETRGDESGKERSVSSWLGRRSVSVQVDAEAVRRS